MIPKQQFGPDDKFFVSFDDLDRSSVTYSNVNLCLLHGNIFPISKQQYLQFLSGEWIPSVADFYPPALLEK